MKPAIDTAHPTANTALLDPDREALLRLCQSQQHVIDALTSQVKVLAEQVQYLRQMKFGRSAEALPNVLQGELFEAAPGETLPPKSPVTTEAPVTPKKRGGRRPLPRTLESRREVHTLSEDARRCECGCVKKKIGEDISEQLDIIPARLLRIEHVREKYACPRCQNAPVHAPLPPSLLPKTRASNALLAHIIVSKFLYHVPFYRQSSYYKALGFDVSKANLVGWAIRLADALNPLLERLHWHLMACHVLQADETGFTVDKRKEYAWLWRGRCFHEDGSLHYTLVYFQHESTRNVERINKMLSAWQGMVLQTDGLPLYRNSKVRAPGLTQGCMAHARRYFFKCVQALPKAERGAHPAAEFLGFFKQLYAIERRIASKSAAERYRCRQQESKPVLEKMRARLVDLLPAARPGSGFGAALLYLRGEWDYLVTYCEYGELDIDNNRIENCVRPFAVGRRNWLHAKSKRGAEANCVFYTLLATAKANGVDPAKYLVHIFKELASMGRKPSIDALDALMPWAPTVQEALSQVNGSQ